MHRNTICPNRAFFFSFLIHRYYRPQFNSTTNTAQMCRCRNSSVLIAVRCHRTHCHLILIAKKRVPATNGMPCGRSQWIGCLISVNWIWDETISSLLPIESNVHVRVQNRAMRQLVESWSVSNTETETKSTNTFRLWPTQRYEWWAIDTYSVLNWKANVSSLATVFIWNV